jgi:hypothetical protein
MQASAELHDKLESFVLHGGHLLITAGNLARFPQGLAAVQATASSRHFAANTQVRIGKTQLTEEGPFDLCGLAFPRTARILAESAGLPAVIEVSHGQGRMTVFASPFGVVAEKAEGRRDRFRSELNRPRTTPYPLLEMLRTVLDKTFRSQMPAPPSSTARSTTPSRTFHPARSAGETKLLRTLR